MPFPSSAARVTATSSRVVSDSSVTSVVVVVVSGVAERRRRTTATVAVLCAPVGDQRARACLQKKRKTRREVFLERIEGLVPWAELEARIEPYYPRAGRGRRLYPLATMLRIHLVQLCYNQSDPAC